MSNFIYRTKCRICGSKKLVDFCDLNTTPLADEFPIKKTQKEKQYPLIVKICSKCFLVQLVIDVDPKVLFGKSYAFYTMGSPSAVAHFKEYAATLKKELSTHSKGNVMEIASNDGTLLGEFNSKVRIGVEPASDVAKYANEHGIKTLPRFFDTETAFKLLKDYGHFDLIMANNVLAHVENLHEFVRLTKNLLKKDGVFVFEVQYLPYLLFRNQFDHIYHEHRCYFSLYALSHLLADEGLKIVKAVDVDAQGGSLRVYACRNTSTRKADRSAVNLLEQEYELGLTNIKTYMGFQSRVDYIRIKLREMIDKLKKEGKTVIGYGASAKGNTLLNYCNIGSKDISCIVDRTPYKIGKYSPGKKLPIVLSVGEPNDYYLLLVWNYLDGVLARERNYRKQGGKFIVPIPYPQIV